MSLFPLTNGKIKSQLGDALFYARWRAKDEWDHGMGVPQQNWSGDRS